jgi:hypothetical protein
MRLFPHLIRINALIVRPHNLVPFRCAKCSLCSGSPSRAGRVRSSAINHDLLAIRLAVTRGCVIVDVALSQREGISLIISCNGEQ